eukprot:TRINITY_DN13293_c0_g1_i2.p1 TRINITY_DN13293_c0_g1~~TRINITY_DN13293_c0_g1_i2.p1  ORF type:complete len:233 (+),score=19.48 TRINITY_DN13293_c0_g1_i2:63-761(+)
MCIRDRYQRRVHGESIYYTTTNFPEESMENLPLLLLTILLLQAQTAYNYDYCVDEFCPYGCCIDIYTCSPWEDCKYPDQELLLAEIDDPCDIDEECNSGCCIKNICNSEDDCSVMYVFLYIIAGLSLLGGFLKLVLEIHVGCQKRKAAREAAAREAARVNVTPLLQVSEPLEAVRFLFLEVEVEQDASLMNPPHQRKHDLESIPIQPPSNEDLPCENVHPSNTTNEGVSPNS